MSCQLTRKKIKFQECTKYMSKNARIKLNVTASSKLFSSKQMMISYKSNRETEIPTIKYRTFLGYFALKRRVFIALIVQMAIKDKKLAECY